METAKDVVNGAAKDAQNRQELMEQHLKLKEDERKSRANSRADSDPISDYLVADMVVTGAEAIIRTGVVIAGSVVDSSKEKKELAESSEKVSNPSEVESALNKGNWSGIPDDHIASKAIEPTIPGEIQDGSISSVTDAMKAATIEHDTAVTNIVANNAANSGGIMDTISSLASDAVDTASSVASGAVDIAGSVASGAVDVVVGAVGAVGSIFDGL